MKQKPSLLYRFGVLLGRIVFHGFFCTRINGRERVPVEGGLLIICNHISFFDPPLLGTASPRPVGFMAMAELFRRPWMATIMRQLGVFSVDRSNSGHGAAREGIRRLRAGLCVAIFPEGGIHTGKDSVLGGNPVFKPGAGALALLGHATILPVIVRDTRKPYSWRNWLRRETISITFGYPFSLRLPHSLPMREQRALARELLREQLLRTVEID